uniref:Uncharacterized protein n=1 Tax=Arundo donax TaxID=35708 RepID=A0A0A9AS82_ARUDO
MFLMVDCLMDFRIHLKT